MRSDFDENRKNPAFQTRFTTLRLVSLLTTYICNVYYFDAIFYVLFATVNTGTQLLWIKRV